MNKNEPYCSIVISPKVMKFMKKYNKRLQHEFDKHGMVDVNHTGSLVND